LAKTIGWFASLMDKDARAIRQPVVSNGFILPGAAAAAGIATAPDHFLGDYPMFKWQYFADAIPSAGFRIEDRRGTDVYICRRDAPGAFGEPPP
jgi:hypothetical protein